MTEPSETNLAPFPSAESVGNVMWSRGDHKSKQSCANPVFKDTHSFYCLLGSSVLCKTARFPTRHTNALAKPLRKGPKSRSVGAIEWSCKGNNDLVAPEEIKTRSSTK